MAVRCAAANMAGGDELRAAAGRGDLPRVTTLLAQGAQVNGADEFGWTALHSAARDGRVAVVEALLARGAQRNCADNDGRTALHNAARNGHVAVVEALLARGAQVNVADRYGTTALHRAAASGHVAVVEALLARGAQVNGASHSDRTALLLAADQGHVAVVEALLAQGAQVNGADRWGTTALHGAASRGRVGVVEALLGRGAQVNAGDNSGRTALHEAAAYGHVAVVEELVARGADVHSTDRSGDTPLHFAAKRNDQSAALALCRAGADPLKRNNGGKTPLSLLPKDSDAAKQMRKIAAALSDLKQLWLHAKISTVTPQQLLAALSAHHITSFSHFGLAHHFLLLAVRQGVLTPSQLKTFGGSRDFILEKVYLPATKLARTTDQKFWLWRIQSYAARIGFIDPKRPELLELDNEMHEMVQTATSPSITFDALTDVARTISFLELDPGTELQTLWNYDAQRKIRNSEQSLKRRRQIVLKSAARMRLRSSKQSLEQSRQKGLDISNAAATLRQLHSSLQRRSRELFIAAVLSFGLALIPVVGKALCKAALTTSEIHLGFIMEQVFQGEPMAVTELLAVDVGDFRTVSLLTSSQCLGRLPSDAQEDVRSVVEQTPFGTLTNLQQQLSEAFLDLQNTDVHLEGERYSSEALRELLDDTPLEPPQFDLARKISTLPCLRLCLSPVFENWLALAVNKFRSEDKSFSEKWRHNVDSRPPVTFRENLAAAMVYWASVTLTHSSDDNHFRVLLLFSAVRIIRANKEMSMETDYVVFLLSEVLSGDWYLLHEHPMLLEDKHLVTQVGDHIPSLMHSLGNEQKGRVQKAWQLLLLMQIISVGNGLVLDEEDFSLISELDGAAEFSLWDLEQQFQHHGICVQPIPNSKLPLETSTSSLLTFSNEKSTLLVRLKPSRLSAVGFSIFSLILVCVDHESRVLMAVIRELKSFQNCFISELQRADDECEERKTNSMSRKVFVSLEWIYRLNLSHNFVAMHGVVGSVGALVGNLGSSLRARVRVERGENADDVTREGRETHGSGNLPSQEQPLRLFSRNQNSTAKRRKKNQNLNEPNAPESNSTAANHSIRIYLDRENKLVHRFRRSYSWSATGKIQIGVLGIELPIKSTGDDEMVGEFFVQSFQHFMTYSFLKNPGFMTRIRCLEDVLKGREVFPKGYNQSLLTNVISEEVSCLSPCEVFKDSDCRIRCNILRKRLLPFRARQLVKNGDPTKPAGYVFFQDACAETQAPGTVLRLPFKAETVEDETVMQVTGRYVEEKEDNGTQDIVFDIV